MNKAIKLLMFEPKIKLELPVWACIFALFIPIMAYIDLIFVGKHSYVDYVILCSIETLLIYVGYLIGLGTNKLKKEMIKMENLTYRQKEKLMDELKKKGYKVTWHPNCLKIWTSAEF